MLRVGRVLDVEHFDVVNDAAPPLTKAIPMMVAPSKKVTDPVAVLGVTVAVKVSEAPKTEGLVPFVRARLTVELALMMPAPERATVCWLFGAFRWLSVNVNTAVRVPAANGLNVTVYRQR